MDLLLDEKLQSLTPIVIDEVRASDESIWQIGEKRPGSPSDVVHLIRESTGGALRIFVQDRVLCDATRRSSSAETLQLFRAYREALAASTLESITPLANQDRSFDPKEEPNSRSVCAFRASHSGPIRMDPPQEQLGGAPEGHWFVGREEIDPSRRLDCWYYQDRFRKLRKARRDWTTPRFSDYFRAETERARRKPLTKRPNLGALEWLSSAQIHERLHAIVPTRVRDWGEIGRDVPLEPGDVLASMVGFTQVKFARYEGPADTTTASLYLLRFHPQQGEQSPQEAAAVWLALTTDDFLDQVRMELSDRVMKPLTEHFPTDAHVPALRPGGIARTVEAITRLALGSSEDGPLRSNLSAVEAALSDDAVSWPGKWACLRRIWQFLGSDEKAGEVMILSKDSAAGLECVKALRQQKVKVGEPRSFRVSDSGLASALARAVAKAPAVVSLTSANTPLRLASEQVGASHALDIAADSHRFAFYSPEGATQNFPARQFVEHLFSETESVPESVDICGNEVSALADHLRELLAQPSAFDAYEVIKRLAALDSPEEPFARFLPVANPASPLDRVRPALSALLVRLVDGTLTSKPRARSVSATRTRRRHKPFTFGKFVTADAALAKRIDEFSSIFGRALELTKGESNRVIALLIEADTGCGKDELVDYLEIEHQTRFMHFGVGADPKLILSQLFGHKIGAFTGATDKRLGVFGKAAESKRPVFLNELNSYPEEVQFRLLTVIEHGLFTPLGGEEDDPKKYQGVVIAASNQPLVSLVAKDEFRRDLQMRLGSPFTLSPLKDRPQDIDHIFDRVCNDLAKNEWALRPQLDPGARKRLLKYYWPGNGRELAGLIMRAFLLRKAVIDEDFLEGHFPHIYSGTAPAAERDGGWLNNDAPLELACLESLLAQPRMTKLEQYRALKKRLDGSEPTSNELPDWVDGRRDAIVRFRNSLPLVSAYLEEISAKRARRKKGIS